MSKLNEDERDFIDIALSNRAGVEIQETEDSITVIPKEKKKVKERGSRGLTYWIAAIFILPFILSGIFFAALLRVESFVGGKETLNWLSEQEITPELERVIAAANLDWLPLFLDIYANRGLIVAITFAIPLLIVAALIVYDVHGSKSSSYENETDELDEES